MKRKDYITIHEGVKIPTWALCYLINGDDSGLEAEDKKLVDDWVEKTREGGRINVCYPKEGEEAYFCRYPAFGLPCDVEECDVIVDKSPRYPRCDYPCCGQSRFEPLLRQAIDGRWWWILYDNKEGKFVRGSKKFKTRKALVKCLFISWKFGATYLEYEPDDSRHDLEWLKKQDQIPCQ